jgi:hypothetical protein
VHPCALPGAPTGICKLDIQLTGYLLFNQCSTPADENPRISKGRSHQPVLDTGFHRKMERSTVTGTTVSEDSVRDDNAAAPEDLPSTLIVIIDMDK